MSPSIREPKASLGFGELSTWLSPRQSRRWKRVLRMLLVLAGLPRPEIQVSINDDQGHFLGRPDLLYRDRRLVIEYDGSNHRDRLVDDNRRQNGFVGAGYRLLRFTAPDVLGTPDSVAMQVRIVLAPDASR
jgi:hypothetical protein